MVAGNPAKVIAKWLWWGMALSWAKVEGLGMSTLAISEVVWSYPPSWLDYNLWTLSNQSVPPTEIMVMDASVNPAFHQAYTKYVLNILSRFNIHIPQAWPNYAYCQNVVSRLVVQSTWALSIWTGCFPIIIQRNIYKHLSPKCMINSNARFLPLGFDLGDPNTLFGPLGLSYVVLTLPQDKIQVGTLIVCARDWLFKATWFWWILYAHSFTVIRT